MKPKFRTFRTLRALSTITGCLVFSFQQTDAAEISKLTNATPLNQGASWNGGVIPSASDVMLWNSLYTLPSAAGNLSPLGGDMNVQGLKVTDVGGPRNAVSSLVGFNNASSANTLTIGSAGINLSTAFQSLMIQSKVTLSADQNWIIADANTNANPAGFNNNEDLSFFSQAAGVPIDFGGFTVTTSGAGQSTITSGHTLSNGNLIVGNNLFNIQGGSSRVTSLTDTLNVTVNSGTFRLQTNSGANGISLVSAAPITLNGGALTYLINGANSLNSSGALTINGGTINYLLNQNVVNTFSGPIIAQGNSTWNVTGAPAAPTAGTVIPYTLISGPISGSANIRYQNTGTGVTTLALLTGDNSAFTGTFDINGASGNRSLRLASATAGSADATWNIAAGNTLQIDGVTVDLGNLTGAGIITNSSADAPATVNISSGLFSGSINDGTAQPININKVGDGDLVLNGISTYAGTTTVSSGTLAVAADRLGGGPVIVADGASFDILANESTAYETSSVTLGSATGANLGFEMGLLENPQFAALVAGELIVNSPSTITVSGKNLTTGSIPLIDYTTIGGSSGFAGLTLQLPARTTGTLVNSGFGLSANITGTEQAKWNGNLSENWDTTSLNWRTTGGNTATAYIENATTSDVANFDDSATGTGTVNLTGDFSPIAAAFSNSSKNYTLTGDGTLTGATLVEKSGTGTVTFANPNPYSYTGGTFVSEGTLRLGDGATPGAGEIIGAVEIADGATLVVDRADDATFTNTLTGPGTFEKDGSGVLTIPGAVTIANPIALTEGTLRFTGGPTLTGKISGPGQLEAAGGNFTIQGFEANTNTGLTTVSAGALRLSNPALTNAVGGDIRITNTGTLAILAEEQIPDTATIFALGSSADSLIGTVAKETVANVHLEGTSPATQVILRNEMTITGTGTVVQGILGVASSQNGTINGIVMTSPTAMIRIAGSGGPSILRLGTGGLTTSGGEFQVKFNTNNQDATLELSGNVTTTGDFRFTNAGYTGVNLNVIKLFGARTFDIGAGTTTTVAPDISSDAAGGSLVKAGEGTLTLTNLSNAAPADGTTVNAGALLVNGSLSGTTQVNAAGTIGGTGILAGPTTVAGTVAPGNAAVGTLATTAGITLGSGSTLDVQVGSWAGVTPGTHWDLLAADALTLTATPAAKMTVRVSGSPADFEESAKTILIASSSAPLAGFDAAAITIDDSGFIGTGTWQVQKEGETITLSYTAGEGGGSAYDDWAAAELPADQRGATADPDGDGQPNFLEFALNSSPASGASTGNRMVKTASVGGENALTLTIPVRANATFAGADAKSATIDGVTYRVESSDDLGTWNLVVSEVTGADATAIQAGLPALDNGWTYRSFRSPGPIAGDPREFIRVVVTNN